MPKLSAEHKKRRLPLARVGSFRVGDVSEILERVEQAKSSGAVQAPPAKERLSWRAVIKYEGHGLLSTAFGIRREQILESLHAYHPSRCQVGTVIFLQLLKINRREGAVRRF